MKHRASTLQKQLNNGGFMNVPNTSYWINPYGGVRDLSARNPLRVMRPRVVLINGKQWRTAKAILYAFKGIVPRHGYITYLDGNTANCHISNIEYNSDPTQIPFERVDREALRLALRCYFKLSDTEKTRTGDPATNTMLSKLAATRNYLARNRHDPNIKPFADWLEAAATYTPKPTTIAAEAHKLRPREIHSIIAHHVNKLCSEVIAERRHDASNQSNKYQPLNPQNNELN